MGDPETYKEMRDVWTDFNHRQEFEHGLINNKTTWLLATQSILFAAYGVTFGIPAESRVDDSTVAAFRDIVAVLGSSIALVILIGVLGLIASKYLSWRTYTAFFVESQPLKLPGPLKTRPLEWGVLTANTLITLVPDVAIPVVFIAAWGLVAVMT
jgi:hypothetical protein